MELTVLNSSSLGNCYILQNDAEALVIEAGVALKDVKAAVDFNISKIVGVLVTHEHQDHAGHVNEFLKNRVQVFMSYGTFSKVLPEDYTGQLPRYLRSLHKEIIGNFHVLPFDVKHDAAEPIGFLIHHPETGKVLFVTDSYYIPYNFDGLNNIIIEANYRMDILQANIDAGRIPGALRTRTLESHMSLDTCIEALQANDLSKVNNIVLIHLSDGNSNEKQFTKAVKDATGKTVYAAKKGLSIPFNKTPF